MLGGTGLISQEIVRQLAASGDTVHVLNRGNTAAELPEGVERLTADRSGLGDMRPWIEKQHFDCLIDMIGFTEQEAAGLVNAAAGVVEHVLYCSTVDVFQKPQPSYPVIENARRLARESFPYAVGKVESEVLLEQAAESGAFELTILRPAQTYGGPNHGPVHPLGHWKYQLWRISTGRTILMHGDGTSLWSACHARDVGAAFAAAAHEPAARGRSYNLASAELVTWTRYWEIVADAFAYPRPDIVTVPSEILSRRLGDEASWLMENFRFNNVFDCTAAAVDLGFAGRTSLQDGMSETVGRHGSEWLAAGGAEAGSSYDQLTEETIAWWQERAGA